VSLSVASIEIREEDEDWYKFVNIILCSSYIYGDQGDCNKLNIILYVCYYYDSLPSIYSMMVL